MMRSCEWRLRYLTLKFPIMSLETLPVRSPQQSFTEYKNLLSFFPSYDAFSKLEEEVAMKVRLSIGVSNKKRRMDLLERSLREHQESLNHLKQQRQGSDFYQAVTGRLEGILPYSLVTESCQELIKDSFSYHLQIGYLPSGRNDRISWSLGDQIKGLGIFTQESASAIDDHGLYICRRRVENDELPKERLENYNREFSQRYSDVPIL